MWISVFSLVTFCGYLQAFTLKGDYEELNLRDNFFKRLENFYRSPNNGISSDCVEQLSHYKRGISLRQFWAISMFDAGGKFPSGIVSGNFVDLGSFDECINVEQSVNKNESILGKYCIGKMSFDFDINRTDEGVESMSKTVNMQLASCFPNACSALEMEMVYRNFGINMTFDESQCQTKINQPKLDGRALGGVIFFAVVLTTIVFSTIYDVFMYYIQKKPSHYLFVAFSALENGKKILTINNNPTQITCLHGLRVITMMWIVLDHRYNIQTYFPSKNYYFHQNWVKNSANLFMLNITVAVDTFLLLGGTVVSYNFMRNAQKGVKFNILKHYVHRYLRLTPVIAAVTIFLATIIIHLGSGPLWPNGMQQNLVRGCQENWWKTILYIQNYGQTKFMCISHGWYLSVDMQLYLLSPIFLISLKRWPKFGVAGICLLIICNVIACFLIAWFLELSAYMQAISDFEKEMQYVWYYYFPTYTRAAPWLIGILLGYYIFRCKQTADERIKIRKALVALLWILSLATLCACVFTGHNIIVGEYDKIINSLHISLVRPAWAIAISWLIFACVNGYGGPVNSFLSMPLFHVLSKLVYCLYIIHYVIIYTIVSEMRTTIIFDNFYAMHTFWGDFAFSLVVALFLSLAFELPVAAIERFLFGGSSTSSP